MSDTAVARTPSVTPDLGSSHSSFTIVMPSRLPSAAAAPPLPSTSAAIAVPVPRRAAPATGASREFIDLTGPSPPTRQRNFPDESSDELSGQRRSKRARVAPAPLPETVVLSDSDSDDDIIVVNPVAGPTGSSGSSADSSHSAPSSTGATVASSVGGQLGRIAFRGRANVVLPAGGQRGALATPAPGPVPPASGSRLGIGGSLMSAINRLTGAAQPPPANAAVRRTRAAVNPAPNLRASSISSTSSTASANAQRDDFIEQQIAALAAARRDDFEGMEAYYGHVFGLGVYGGGGGYDHLPSGLQGVIPGWKKHASPGKKFGVRMSHPRKVEEGFSRNIINPPEDGEAPPPPPVIKGKGKRVASAPAPIETEPACASCLEPLRLAQAGEGRIWVLCCGHTICGKCLGDAKMRCEEIKAVERKNRWAMDVDGKGKEIVLDDDDDDEVPMPSKGKGKAKAKGKGKAKETDVDESWTTCPIVECDGAMGDLLAGDSDPARPFEAYV